MCDPGIVKSAYFILKLIDSTQNDVMEREELKHCVKEIRDRLAENLDVIIDFDFREHQSDLYSNRLNEILEFNIGSNFIEEQYGSIHYRLTDRGRNFVNNTPDIYDEYIGSDFISAIEEVISEVLHERH